ncbi:MAG: MBL fold metallo-hydrolase [Hyphomonadaceae bacterium]|nr:MBL fold metallo-hydrolase [Hyphomonadaceae bacterium]
MKSTLILTVAALGFVACSPSGPPQTNQSQTGTATPPIERMALDTYSDGQKQVLEAFGWTFDPTKISTAPLKEGFAVIFGEGGNILVSVGDDGVLLVDDQMPEMHEALLAEIRKLGGKKVDKVVNTHWHFDHAEGNRAFGELGAEIIAQKNSTEYMKSAHDINLVQIVYPQQAYPEAAIPTLSFKDAYEFNMNGNDIALYNFGPAHTTGDAIVHFKTTNIVHMGDVGNFSGMVFIDAGNGGSIDGAIKTIRKTLELIDDQTVVVPGHGPIKDKAALTAYVTSLETVRARIAEQMTKGLNLEEIQALNLAEEFFGSNGPLLIDRAYTSLN